MRYLMIVLVLLSVVSLSIALSVGGRLIYSFQSKGFVIGYPEVGIELGDFLRFGGKISLIWSYDVLKMSNPTMFGVGGGFGISTKPFLFNVVGFDTWVGGAVNPIHEKSEFLFVTASIGLSLKLWNMKISEMIGVKYSSSESFGLTVETVFQF